jgi:hypothetical protein
VTGGRLPQRAHLGGQPGDERIRAARRSREQHAHGQVRERELQQEQPQLAGGQDHGSLHREHYRRNRQQARH